MKKKWTHKTAVAEGKKYPSRSEWAKEGGGSYNYCRKHGLLKKEPKMVILRSDGEVFKTLKDAADAVNGQKIHILNCLKGKNRTAYGYNWAWIDNPFRFMDEGEV